MTLENSDNITSLFLKAANQHPDAVAIIEGVNNITSVSYTHLTLPTSDLV